MLNCLADASPSCGNDLSGTYVKTTVALNVALVNNRLELITDSTLAFRIAALGRLPSALKLSIKGRYLCSRTLPPK
jgi:hypothetical protein